MAEESRMQEHERLSGAPMSEPTTETHEVPRHTPSIVSRIGTWFEERLPLTGSRVHELREGDAQQEIAHLRAQGEQPRSTTFN